MPLLFHLKYTELPSLAIQTHPALYPKLNLTNFTNAEEQIDISILQTHNLTLCYGKEWYRFPSSFLVPNEVRVEFVKSDFKGILPKHFVERRDEVKGSKASIVKRLEIASQSPPGFNDQNQEETDRYVSIYHCQYRIIADVRRQVPVESCSYLIDLDFPRRYMGESVSMSSHEPRYAIDAENWERVVCKPFLDASQTSMLRRTLRFAFSQDPNPYGDYCLLRNRKLVNSIPL
jgi:alpha-1,2-mannosyltransferase